MHQGGLQPNGAPALSKQLGGSGELNIGEGALTSCWRWITNILHAVKNKEFKILFNSWLITEVEIN